jgi:hypothetical protein
VETNKGLFGQMDNTDIHVINNIICLHHGVTKKGKPDRIILKLRESSRNQRKITKGPRGVLFASRPPKYIGYNKFSPCRELIMPSQHSYQDTNISLETGLTNIQRSTPTREQHSPLEAQVEETNQDANLSADFAALTTKLNELNLSNMSSSTKDYIVRKVTSL